MEPLTQPAVPVRRGRMLRRLWHTRGPARWLFVIGVAITLMFVVLAVFAPLISPYRFDQYRTAAGMRFPKQAHPSAAHWFGTSVQSTDVFSHIVYGSRTALEVVVLAVVF